MHRYQYAELRAAALAPNATKQDRLDFYAWLVIYDMNDWNGECFDIDGGLSLYPIYEEQDGDFEIVDAEIR